MLIDITLHSQKLPPMKLFTQIKYTNPTFILNIPRNWSTNRLMCPQWWKENNRERKKIPFCHVVWILFPPPLIDRYASRKAAQILHGGGTFSNSGNRWFDKTLQVKKKTKQQQCLDKFEGSFGSLLTDLWTYAVSVLCLSSLWWARTAPGVSCMNKPPPRAPPSQPCCITS